MEKNIDFGQQAITPCIFNQCDMNKQVYSRSMNKPEKYIHVLLDKNIYVALSIRYIDLRNNKLKKKNR